MKAKKGIMVVAIAVVALAASLGVLSYVSYAKGFKEFIADGYILKPSAEVNVMTDANEQHYFSQGTKYLAKYGAKVSFTDAAGEEVSLNKEQFIHYADGSLGSFTKGVIMDVTDLSEEQYGYYNLTQNTVLIKSGKAYEVSTRGEAMNLEEFIWKITDNEYMLVSPEVTLQLGNANTITLPDYAQIKYVDNGIVRIVHQQGTYQTVSSEALLTTAAGAELNLVGKNFYIDGKPGISLDRMSLSDDTYIDLDENADTPEFKIPKFNVVNGKNGASGANGANGEDGTDGESGLEGIGGGDGGDGASGLAGSSGGAGGRGSDGSDGVEGDSGVMGYDGKPGTPGTNGRPGEREDEMSGIVPAEIYVRPTVTMESKSYATSPGSVEMQLNLTDLDQAIVQDTLSVTIYDRETMTAVATLPQWATDLYNSNSVSIKADGLAPDKEYVLIVAGKYFTEEEDSEGKEANLFTKIFRTDSLGITLEKLNVTDDSITVVTTMTPGSQVESYDVKLFYYDSEGNPKEVYTYTNQTTAGELKFSADNPAISAINSNTPYYAVLEKVNVREVGEVSSKGTEIPVHTLKKKPYATAPGSGVEKAIATVNPEISIDNKTKTISIGIPDQIGDKDNGVYGYRYELYTEKDITKLTSGAVSQLSDLTPAYVAQTDVLKTQAFQIPIQEGVSEQPKYVGRIVVLFNDNEKDVEFATGFSGLGQLDEEQFPTVDWSWTKISHDSLMGTITIRDDYGMTIPYLETGYGESLFLTIQSNYGDLFSQEFKVEKDGIKIDANSKVATVSWRQDDLRRDTSYNLLLQGPLVSSKNAPSAGVGLTDTERMSFLSGSSKSTMPTSAVRLVGSKVTYGSAAFAMRINFTQGETNATATTDFYKHEVQTMEEVVLQLYQRDDKGVETKVGSDLPLKDLWTQQYYIETPSLSADSNEWKTKSTFYNCGWIDISKTKLETASTVPTELKDYWMYGYYSMDPNKGDDATGDDPSRLVVMPSNFGVDNNDALFFNGNTYIIRVRPAGDNITSTTDYTKHKNDIGFADDGNRLEFKLEKKHTSAEDPNSQVKINLVTKSGDKRPTSDEKSSKNDDTLDDNTVVGMEIEGLYRYSDVKQITYRMYKIRNDVENPDKILYSEDNIFDKDHPDGLRPNIYFGMATDPFTGAVPQEGYNDKKTAYLCDWEKDPVTGEYLKDAKGNRVFDWSKKTPIADLVGTIKVTYNDSDADNGTSQVLPITIYFNDLFTEDTEAGISCTWEGGIKELARGDRFFVAYDTFVSWKQINDGPDKGKDHAYPDCTYHGVTTQIPFYRSGVFEVSKQQPKIERYPLTETKDQVTWNYRIIDPDETVVMDETDNKKFYFELKTASSLSMSSPSTTQIQETASSYIGTVYSGTKTDQNGVAVSAKAFTPLDLPVNDKSYYTVTVRYKSSNSTKEEPKPLTSYPVYKQEYRKITTAAFGTNASAGVGLNSDNLGVKLWGQPTSKVDNLEPGTNYEKALINQGGYRYRLTMWGNYKVYDDPSAGTTLDNIAALRVTFYGMDADGKFRSKTGAIVTNKEDAMQVVYDPVYISIRQGNSYEDAAKYKHPIADAYIDSSALNDFLKTASTTGITKAKVGVEAYYNTGVGGFQTYVTPTELIDKEPAPDTYDSFGAGQTYALKWMTSAGTYNYKTMFTERSKTTYGDAPTGTVGKSIFVPMNVKENVNEAFSEPTPSGASGKPLEGVLGVRYAETAMALSDIDAANPKTRLTGTIEGVNPIKLNYDATGAKLIGAGAGSYVTLEKLGLYSDIDFALSDAAGTVELSDIMPAIDQKGDVSRGVSSFYMEFDTVGTGAYEGRELYARVYEKLSDNTYALLDLTREQNNDQDKGSVPIGAYYYKAKQDSNGKLLHLSADDYTKPAYQTALPIKIQKQGDRLYLPVLVRNLAVETKNGVPVIKEYVVQIFAYDKAGKVVDLYSLTPDTTGYEYKVSTRQNITIKKGGDNYVYTTYQDKRAEIGFAVGDNEDGLGLKVLYNIKDVKTGDYVYTTQQELGTDNYTISTPSIPYFSNEIANNRKFTALLTPGGGAPGTGTLAMNRDYIVEIEIYNSSNNDKMSNDSDDYKIKFHTPDKLNEPTAYIQGLSSKDTNNNLQITAEVVIMDAKHAMKEIRVQLLDSSGKQIIMEQTADLDASTPGGRKSKTLVFANNLEGTQLTAGTNYMLKLLVPYDLYNTGVSPFPYTKEVVNTMSLGSAVSATVGSSATPTNINLYFSNLQNFGSVKYVDISVYKKTSTSLELVMSGSKAVDVSSKTTEFNVSYGWTSAPTANGTHTYEVQIQYKSADGTTILGKDTTTLVYVVAGSNSGIVKMFTSLFGNGTSDAKVEEVFTGVTSEVTSGDASEEVPVEVPGEVAE